MATRQRQSDRSTGRRRRIAVVTGTRAEFGLLDPVLRAMARRRRLQPRLIVTGMHLLRRFGRTIDHIRDAGFSIDAVVRMQSDRDEVAQQPIALSRGIAGIARAIDDLDCEIVVVLGDRIEAFAGACAATLGRRLLAHIHGGDRALGELDDVLRNAISRLAHVHLVASKDAAHRLRRMGEPASRIHRVGAPGLDDIRAFRQAERRSRRSTDRWLAQNLGPLAGQSYAVVVQHPTGRSQEQEAATMRLILAAVERCGLAGVVLYPNSDPGHSGIISVIRELRDRRRWRVFRSLGRVDYLRLLCRAAVLVGNSSSGIIESASIGINAVNVGSRQAGRLRCGPNVIDARETGPAITRAVRRALRRAHPASARCGYGDGRAGERIAEVLQRLVITPALRARRLTY